MQKYNNTKIIIGLDHGYGNIKTAHRVFRTGVECFEEEPIVSVNYIKYKDKHYVIGENHLMLIRGTRQIRRTFLFSHWQDWRKN